MALIFIYHRVRLYCVPNVYFPVSTVHEERHEICIPSISFLLAQTVVDCLRNILFTVLSFVAVFHATYSPGSNEGIINSLIVALSQAVKCSVLFCPACHVLYEILLPRFCTLTF